MTYDELLSTFEQHFSRRPTHQVWSPGRVNLIGEHTDYNMLPVLPMAINYGLTVLMAPNTTGTVRVVNSDPKYPPIEFEAGADIAKSPPGHAGNYIKAPISYLFEWFARERGGAPVGFDALFSSNLPAAAGLSSSSATVVASYLCFAAANGGRLPREEEAEAMRLAERFVGTASGGMDQATILLGEEGKALLIEFDPVHTRSVSLPGDVVFFAVDSLQRAAKSGSARLEYNRRTFECQCAVELLRQHVLEQGRSPGCFDHVIGEAPGWHYLRDVAKSFCSCELDVVDVAREVIGEREWTVEQLHEALGSKADELLQAKMLPPRGDQEWQRMPRPKPFARMKHVVEEARRVEECAEAFEGNDVAAVSAAMAASHASCRDLYEISTDKIEELIAAVVASGAHAGRITGAGFGGSIVAMVPRDRAEEFRRGVWERYYEPMAQAGEHLPPPEQCILLCLPSEGARYTEML